MKAVMISIHPKWVEKIASGEKTVEVRKSRPRLETPFKVYIYCTKAGKMFFHGGIGEKQVLFKNPDTGRIKWDYAFELMAAKNEFTVDNFLSGKVIGEFVCDYIITYMPPSKVGVGYTGYLIPIDDGADCLSAGELLHYGNGKYLYGWHISDLKIYDKPKEIGEFYKCCTNYKDLPSYEQLFCNQCQYSYNINCFIKCRIDGKIFLTRPPQSWCYVEENDND